MATTRVAHCACGQLRAETQGDPLRVNLCHCTECQRRTGSPFGIGAWYVKSDVRVIGDHKTFTRHIEDRTVSNHFCSNCGGNILWEASKRDGLIAVAVGMFGDPDFPAPAGSIFEKSKHPWVEFGGLMDHFESGLPE